MEAKLERHKLSTESPEYAYTDYTVIHTTYDLDVTGGVVLVKTKWKREKEVGAGGFGTIWLEKEDGGRARAVKSLSTRFFKMDFLREVEILADLRDYPDHFVQFMGWFEDKESIFIAMEYTQYGDLRQYIDNSGSKVKAEAKAITRQLLEGLVILHKEKYCHRDFNPHNILVVSITPIRVKIADFGVSKREIDTQLKTNCGTPGYRAPEQLGLLPRELKVGRTYTNAVDLWALGCVVHELLTSEKPFLYHDSDQSTATSGIKSGLASAQVDMQLLYEFSHGIIQFPAESLETSGIGDEEKRFIRILLMADPRCRPTASDALKELWLLREADTESIYGEAWPPLPIAVKRGDLDVVRQLLDEGADVDVRPCLYHNGRPYYGQTALQVAAEGGHEKIAQLLLYRGADINAVPSKYGGRTALQEAAGTGNLRMLNLLLCNGADVNAGSAEHGGRTALQAGAGAGRLAVTDWLLRSGASINASPAKGGGRTAIQAAAENGHLDVVMRLLERGADVNAAPARIRGRMALQGAAAGGHFRIVRLLLGKGADINAQPYLHHRGLRYYTQTALQTAAESGHLDIVEFLLESGAEIDALPATHNGRTAVQAAAQGGHLPLLMLLNERGANINMSPATHGGRTAVQAAAEIGHLETTKFLLCNGADINALPAMDGGRTALQAAAQAGHIDVVKVLLRHGADVNAAPALNNGQTAVQAATIGGHTIIVNLLLDNGADVNAKPVRKEVIGCGHLSFDELLDSEVETDENCSKDSQAAAEKVDHHVEQFLGSEMDVDSGLAGETTLHTTGLNLNSDAMGLGFTLRDEAGASLDPSQIAYQVTGGCEQRALDENNIRELQIAAEAGDIDRVGQLLVEGVDINARPAGRTALQAAVQGGNFDFVKFLLDNGADPNSRPATRGGRTALQVAAEFGRLDLINLLLSSGADINADPAIASGRTALQAAAQGGHTYVVRLLLEKGAYVNARPATHDGRTALQAAAESGHLATLKLLIATGANINLQPAIQGGRTALQAAAGGGHIEIMTVLLHHGAMINDQIADNYGRTALQAAAEGGHSYVAMLLLKYGADIDAARSRIGGITALEAAHIGGPGMVALLSERIRAQTRIMMGQMITSPKQ